MASRVKRASRSTLWLLLLLSTPEQCIVAASLNDDVDAAVRVDGNNMTLRLNVYLHYAPFTLRCE
jgi:hypothetical protein